jgi:putative ABC transport system permease protein
MSVVGVVRDARTQDVTEPPVPFYYRAFAQAFYPRMVIFLRSTGEVQRLVDPARRVITELDATIVPRSVITLGEVHDNDIRGFTANARLVTVLGVLALVLAALGLYAVTSYLVTQRTREFGLRLAVGAQPFDLLRNVLGGALQRAGIGIAIGLLGSVAMVQLTERFLFEMSPLDAQSFLAAALLLGGSVALASWLPARRATRVDPVVALRSE